MLFIQKDVWITIATCVYGTHMLYFLVVTWQIQKHGLVSWRCVENPTDKTMIMHEEDIYFKYTSTSELW